MFSKYILKTLFSFFLNNQGKYTIYIILGHYNMFSMAKEVILKGAISPKITEI